MNNSIYVTRSSMPSLDEFKNEIKDIWESHWLTNMGKKHNQFQQSLKRYLETDNVELLVNGHMSLEMTLQAYNFPQGSEIITTPFTFASTTHAIVRSGLIPVFCDIDPNSYVLDSSLIEKLITDKTVGILPVHVYGNICEVEEIDKIAKKHNLIVIYDAAHSFGEKYKGVGVANFGDASCFSFHATKVFNSIEGGASCFRDKKIGQFIYDLKNFGIHGENDVSGIGANAKMNEFCAAMGICNLRHINEEINKRKLVFEKYEELLDGIKGIRSNHIQNDVVSNYSYFPILIDEKVFGSTRDDVYKELVNNNIFPRKYFYPLTCHFSCYEGLFNSCQLSISEYVSNRILTLPLYADLDLNDVERIVRIINSKSEIKMFNT